MFKAEASTIIPNNILLFQNLIIQQLTHNKFWNFLFILIFIFLFILHLHQLLPLIVSKPILPTGLGLFIELLIPWWTTGHRVAIADEQFLAFLDGLVGVKGSDQAVARAVKDAAVFAVRFEAVVQFVA